MKRLLTLIALCVSAASAPTADLLAVYQRALQNDPQLREAEANRLAALETKPQAFAAMIAAAGFRRVSARPLTGGVVALHSGWRL